MALNKRSCFTFDLSGGDHLQIGAVLYTKKKKRKKSNAVQSGSHKGASLVCICLWLCDTFQMVASLSQNVNKLIHSLCLSLLIPLILIGALHSVCAHTLPSIRFFLTPLTSFAFKINKFSNELQFYLKYSSTLR